MEQTDFAHKKESANADGALLLVGSHGRRYGVSAADVIEIVALPELTSIPNGSRDIAGFFDYSGIAVPVLDLASCLGSPSERYSLSDNVVVLGSIHGAFGVLVNDVFDVVSTRLSTISGFTAGQRSSTLIDGVANVEGETILVLDLRGLSGIAHAGQSPTGGDKGALAAPGGFHSRIVPQNLPVFRERARALMREESVENASGLLPVAVVGLNGEYLGLPLAYVREFVEIRNMTPIPCCPPHIVGSMNLRGEVLTVIDVRSVLGMTATSALKNKLVVADCDGTVAGICIDEAYETAFLDLGRVETRSIAVGAGSNPYLTGTAPWDGRALALVDMPRLLASKELIVNEDVEGERWESP